MNGIEIIVGCLTLAGVYITLIKIAQKKTDWHWNFGPYLVGFCSCLWIARLLG